MWLVGRRIGLAVSQQLCAAVVDSSLLQSIDRWQHQEILNAMPQWSNQMIIGQPRIDHWHAQYSTVRYVHPCCCSNGWMDDWVSRDNPVHPSFLPSSTAADLWDWCWCNPHRPPPPPLLPSQIDGIRRDQRLSLSFSSVVGRRSLNLSSKGFADGYRLILQHVNALVRRRPKRIWAHPNRTEPSRVQSMILRQHRILLLCPSASAVAQASSRENSTWTQLYEVLILVSTLLVTVIRWILHFVGRASTPLYSTRLYPPRGSGARAMASLSLFSDIYSRMHTFSPCLYTFDCESLLGSLSVRHSTSLHFTLHSTWLHLDEASESKGGAERQMSYSEGRARCWTADYCISLFFPLFSTIYIHGRLFHSIRQPTAERWKRHNSIDGFFLFFHFFQTWIYSLSIESKFWPLAANVLMRCLFFLLVI